MDLMDRRDEIQDQLALKPQNAAALRNQLNKIEEILGETTQAEDDDMFDLWDQQIAQGKTPDFGRR